MRLRARKSFKVAPGVRLNVGKRGVSTSVGRRGATVNVGRKGVRSTVSIPKTGLSYQTKRSGCGCVLPVIGVISVVVFRVLIVRYYPGIRSASKRGGQGRKRR